MLNCFWKNKTTSAIVVKVQIVWNRSCNQLCITSNICRIISIVKLREKIYSFVENYKFWLKLLPDSSEKNLSYLYTVWVQTDIFHRKKVLSYSILFSPNNYTDNRAQRATNWFFKLQFNSKMYWKLNPKRMQLTKLEMYFMR